MTQYLSDKIKIISLFAILLVIYIHTGIPEKDVYGMIVPYTIRYIIATGLGQLAVPLFYMISGYLFFLNVNNLSDIQKKMRKRVKTLVIPFIIAAIHVPFFYIIIEFIPGISNHINADPMLSQLSSLSFRQIISSLFFDAGNGGPWAFHLWFLRDLIIIVFFAPVWYSLIKIFREWLILILVICYYCFPNLNSIYVNTLFPVFNFVYGLIWFLVGHFYLDKMSAFKGKWIPFCFILLSIYDALYPSEESWAYFLRFVIYLLGCISIWVLYDNIIPQSFSLVDNQYLNIACGYTCFLYLYHDPELHLFVKGIPLLFGDSWCIYTLMFLITPIFYTILFILLGQRLKKHCQGIYSVLTGGR